MLFNCHLWHLFSATTLHPIWQHENCNLGSSASGAKILISRNINFWSCGCASLPSQSPGKWKYRGVTLPKPRLCLGWPRGTKECGFTWIEGQEMQVAKESSARHTRMESTSLQSIANNLLFEGSSMLRHLAVRFYKWTTSELGSRIL